MFEEQSLMPLLLSSIAGMSTVFGAFAIFFSKSQNKTKQASNQLNFGQISFCEMTENKKLITFALAFSAGVMITVSFTDLFASAEEILSKYHGNINGVLYTLLFLIIGSIIAMLIDEFIPETPRKVPSEKAGKLYRVGFVSMMALMIHNLPEGIATFVSGYENITLGSTITLAIALHNIPEGISIAMPIYYSTGSKAKAFKYTFISGLAEPLGALLALLFLRPFINDIILSVIFAILAGIMLYISFAELIPASRQYGYDNIYLFSIFLGICIIPLSHVLMG